MRPRWQNDERRSGMGVPPEAVVAVDRLSAEMRAGGWLTESPERHLLPKLHEWIETQTAWRFERAEQVGDWWEVRLRRTTGGRMRDLRADAVALIGSFAEAATMIRQVDLEGQPAFEVATGQPDDPSGFAAHGHLVRVVIEPV